MRANNRPYDIEASFGRLREILNQSDINYEERQQLPSANSLTFSNGFYADCSAVFIDIQDSSDLPNHYRRPTLARLYRAFISETVAVINGNQKCLEVNIVGDGVWGVFNTPYERDVTGVFNTAAQLGSLVNALNDELRRRSFQQIRVGIGMSDGRALMVKAGLSGSAINDVVYMGDVVNEAAHLASAGSQTANDKELMVSVSAYQHLNAHSKGLLRWNSRRDCWHGTVTWRPMENARRR